ncbi:MAG: ATP-binding protein [Armatimonadota bacterium]
MSTNTRKRVLELEYPAETWVVHDIRELVSRFIHSARLSGDDLEGLKVAISEAASNAICHGSPLGPENRVRLRCELDENQIVFEIFDQGGGFRPREIALPQFEEYKPSGRGLFLMRELMDEVAFTPDGDGTRVRLVKLLPRRPAAGSGAHVNGANGNGKSHGNGGSGDRYYAQARQSISATTSSAS